jgi:hypothetical protein
VGLTQQQPQSSEMIEQSVAELFERGWLVGDERLSVTDTGKEHLSRRMRRTRRDMHRLSAGRGMRGRGPFASAPIDHARDRHGRRRAGVGTDGEGTRQ